MSIFIIVIGIILVVLGSKQKNNLLRNIGIAVALIGCLLTAASNSSFMDGLKGGINDSMNK